MADKFEYDVFLSHNSQALMDDKDSDSFNTIMWPDHTTGFRNASKWQEVLLSGQ